MVIVAADTFQKVKHRKRKFSFAQIRSERLARLFLRARNIQAVVVDLVGRSELKTEDFQRRDNLRACSADERPEFRSDGEKRSGLHFDNPEVVRDRKIQIVSALSLNDLAGTDFGRGIGDPAADFAIRKGAGKLERVRKQAISQ